VLATVIATGVSWAVVQAVSGAVIERGPEPLSPAAIASGLENPISQHRDNQVVASPSPSAPPGAVTGSPPAHTPGVRQAPPATVSSSTFTLRGGSAALSCSGSQIALDWATPNQGYWVETETSDGGNTVEVRFRSDTHESRLRAWCSGGHLVSTTSEQSS